MRCVSLLLLGLVMAAAPCASALAADGTWDVDAAGTWSNTANWLNNVEASGVGYTANFTKAITGGRIVTLDAPRTIGNLNFVLPGDNWNAYTLANSGGSALTMEASGVMPSIYLRNLAGLLISAPLAGTQGIAFDSGASAGSGTNYVRLTGNNTYGGGSVINKGGVSFQYSYSLPSGDVTINSGGFVLDGGAFNTAQEWLARITAGSTGAISVQNGGGTGTMAIDLSTRPNLSLATALNNGVYNGDLIPGSAGYRFGGGGGLAANILSSLHDHGAPGAAINNVTVDGRVTLKGASTYTGATIVTAGRLSLDASGSINNTPLVQLAAGTTFDLIGKYTIGYAVAALSGSGTVEAITGTSALTAASLLPGGDGSVGTLTAVNGWGQSGAPLFLADNGVYHFDIAGTTASPISDLVNFTSSNSLMGFGANATLALANLAGSALDPTGKTFVMFDYKGTGQTLPTWTIDYGATGWAGGVVSVNTVDRRVELTGLTVVPEPGTLALLATGLLGLLAYAWRKRK